MIKNGTDINALRYKSISPLAKAAHDGDLAAVKFLIKNGALAVDGNIHKQKAIEFAELGEHKEIVDFLKKTPIEGEDKQDIHNKVNAAINNPNIQVVTFDNAKNHMDILAEEGVDADVFLRAYAAASPFYHYDIKAASAKDFILEWAEKDGERILNSLHFSADDNSVIYITRQENGDFIASEITNDTFKQTLRTEIIIGTSLIDAISRTAISEEAAASLLDVFSWNIDWEKNIKNGDKLNILYNCEFDKKTGERTICDDILLFSLHMQENEEVKYFYPYTHKDNTLRYYSQKGFSVKKQEMISPISMNRTLPYEDKGKELKYEAETHQGVDFVTSRDTAIYAVADGIISKRGRHGESGNMIALNHGEYVTYYMHLNAFEEGQEIEQKVKQGDIIGYVGATGRTMSNHLHYEIRLAHNNQAVNPLNVMPNLKYSLNQDEVRGFQNKQKVINHLYESLQPNHIPSSKEIFTVIDEAFSIIRKD